MTTYRRHNAPRMGRKAAYRHQIANLRKNSGERLIVQIEEFNGADLVSLVVKRDSSGQHRIGKMKATARLVSIRIDQLSALIKALMEAQNRAVQEGILPSLQGGEYEGERLDKSQATKYDLPASTNHDAVRDLEPKSREPSVSQVDAGQPKSGPLARPDRSAVKRSIP